MKIKILVGYIVFVAILSACKSTDSQTNPLLTDFDTPFNTIPFEKIKPEHYRPAFDTAFAIARDEIDQIINNTSTPDFKNTIEALDKTGGKLNLVSRVLFNLNSAETDTNIQAIVREMSPKLSEFSNDITLNEALFAKVKNVYKNTPENSITPEQRMLLDETYKSFIRSGANLTVEEKESYRAITKELSELSVKFSENTLAATNSFILNITDSSDLAGLPESAVSAAKEEATSRKKDGWVFSLQYPSYIPFMKYSTKRDLRKKLYLASNSRCVKDNENDNRDIIKRIAALKLEEANLLGYPTYAAFALDEKMAKTPGRVLGFLHELLDASLPYAKQEIAEVRDFAKTLGDDIDIELWDWSYYSEKLKKEKYDIDDEVTRPYFVLENVQKGVFGLANKLYGITFVENSDIPVYNSDVKAFEVYDKDQQFLAILYIDYFPREGKQQGAWMTEFKDQKINNGVDERPHVTLVMNFPKPTADKPSLLTHGDVSTLLHEFGHSLHSIFSKVTYSSLSGTNVYHDFVELPSSIMENWAQEKEWLDMVAIHYQTGEKMPKEILQKIIDSKNYHIGYFTVNQLSYGLNDMAWHTLTQTYEGDVISFERKAMGTAQLLPRPQGTCMSTAFGHIFSGGYAAGYYGYLWSNVLDADAFSLYKKNGIFDKKTAQSFRDNILSKGGTEPPMDLYVRFRGSEPSVEPFLERSGFDIADGN
jgi:peptidyl-dipeptidase Dcp